MIGQTLGHYEILEKLGEGGMGVVYLAKDQTLDRKVALKVLPIQLAQNQERLERFQREAKTLAALDHPNIVTIHSVEEDDSVHFLTMQLVEGKPLANLIPVGGLTLNQILELAIPLADALATAHEKGVIHRDLKPANIMVAGDGRVKVLDFGLAKLRSEADAAPMTTALPTEPLTEEGRIVGTMPYMSPEQLEGTDIDTRSDIFSLGVVLYEMATGERPFKGETSVSLISSIVKDSPQPVDLLRNDLPHHLGRVISRCMQKDPKRRYQSAIDVHNELEGLAKETESSVVAQPSSGAVAAPGPQRRFGSRPITIGLAVVVLVLGLLWLTRTRGERTAEDLSRSPGGESAPVDGTGEPMIAVLPFENLGLPEDDYFADGVTEEITSRLAMVSGLGVISRTSSMHYKENRPPLRQIGEELGVDYILEGTVRWARGADDRDRVRITPQLIRVTDDRHLWADNIERELEDIFAVQAEIAQQVIAELGVTLLASEDADLSDHPTDSLAAYEAYLRGLEAFHGRELREAVRLFELAIKEDPDFAEAHARLVSTCARLHFWGDISEDWRGESAAALERAQALAPQNLEVRLANAVYEYYVNDDYLGALTIVNELAERHPNHTEVHSYVAYLSRRLGRWEDSNRALEKVMRLDPRDSVTIEQLADNMKDLGHFEEAEKLYEQCIAVAPERGECYWNRAWNRFHWTGDTNAARQIAVGGPENFWKEYLLIRMDYLDRNDSATLEQLDRLGQSQTGEMYGLRVRATIPYAFGDVERARKAARDLLPVYKALLEKRPKYFQGWSSLALLYAVLGEKEQALTTGERAIEIAQDHVFNGPFTWLLMAETCSIVGEHDRAIDLADQYLSTPCWDHVSHHWFRLDPLWDPVRDNPRFQALLEKYE